MDKETLKQLKQDYNDITKIATGDLKELEELEKNPAVKRYKHLLNIKDLVNTKDESELFGEIINKYGNGLIKSTNNLWFWYLDISASDYEKTFNKPLENIPKDQIVSVYVDIENSTKIIAIPFAEKATFEAQNKVIRGKRTIADPEDRYYNTKFSFFTNCLQKDQKRATQTMLEEENRRLEETIKNQAHELEKLTSCYNHNLITQEEYKKAKQLIFSKQ